MKEFRSQGLGTPHIVIGRGAQLFQEHPDLIVRFQAFLPLGYRPDIPQPAAAGAAGAGAGGGGSGEARLTIPQPPGHGHCGEPWKLQPMRYAEGKGQAPLESDSEEFNNAISYVHKIKTRFLDHPEIYRSFLEILHTYQKEQLHGPGCAPRRMSEEEVFTEVAHLFQGQDDLLLEFQQFLPEAKRSLLTGSGPCEGKGEPQGLEHGRKRSGPRSSAPGLHKSR